MVPINFAHIALNCKDPLKVEQFYTKYFGFQRVRVIDLGTDQIVFTKAGGLCLEIFRATEDAPTPTPEKDGPAWPGYRHMAFTVENVDAKLAEIGDDVRINLGPLDFDDFIPGWRSVWITDPEGNIVEISQGFVAEDNPPPLP